MAKQDVGAIVNAVLKHRAREKKILLGRRKISVHKNLDGDYFINKWEIKVKRAFAIGQVNPFVMADAILNAIEEHNTRVYKEKCYEVTLTKCQIMQRAAYLERSLSPKAYSNFIHSLNHKKK